MDGASVIDAIHHADQEITLLINSWSTPWTDGFWMMMSDKYFWVPTYLICVFFLFKRLGWKKALIVIASAALGFLLCDQIAGAVKYAVSRLRPCYSFNMLNDGLNVLEKRGGFYGFFSAHAANAFSLATCLIIGFRNDKSHTYNAFCKWALIWATLVSVSRIFVGKHYLGDIVVGTLTGFLIGYAVGMTTRYLIRRYVDKVPVKSTVQEGPSPSGSPSNP